MAVFRVERTKDYTVMSNYHLKDKRLSLKAKGLLSQILSLPEDWDYTLSGLASINLESKDAIRSAVQELENAGYIRRRQTVDERGKFSSNEYIIYEQPQPPLDNPLSENPTTENPSPEKPLTENPTQLNTKKTNTQKQNTDLSNTHSIPFHSKVPQAADMTHEAKRGTKRSEMSMSAREVESYCLEGSVSESDKSYERVQGICSEGIRQKSASQKSDLRNLRVCYGTFQYEKRKIPLSYIASGNQF